MSAYDELSDEMIQALKTGVLETERAYNYKWDDVCIGAKIAVDQIQLRINRLVDDNERLMTVNADLLLGGEIVDKMCEEIMDERDQLKAENDELRNLLKQANVHVPCNYPLRNLINATLYCSTENS